MRELTMKKITKSEKHCQALLKAAREIEAKYAAMIVLCQQDASAGDSEKAADIALFAREVERCKRMQAWWLADVERMHAAKAVAKEVAKPEPAKQ
jgi:hypothetical protein